MANPCAAIRLKRKNQQKLLVWLGGLLPFLILYVLMIVCLRNQVIV
jgi:branched-subunit amino acid transport protein AzlD